MKKMTCKQLGGSCDVEFLGETFDDIASQSKKHGMEMFQQGDQDHINAMNELQKSMQSPSDFSKWVENKKEEFDKLPTL